MLLFQITDALHDFYEATFKKAITADVLTHCRHELMQAIWLLLMDDDFMHAYEFGIVIEFLDGISRRVFPRFFTYSADYPEKCRSFNAAVCLQADELARVLLASIKFLAQCPCPRCYTPKDKIGELGSQADRRQRDRDVWEDNNSIQDKINRVRRWIYEKGTNITSTYVKRMMGPQSLNPTMVRNSTSSPCIKL